MQPELSRIIEQVSKEKGIDRTIVVNAIETAMLSAAKKIIGGEPRIEAKFNPEIGEVELFKILTVVEEVTDAEAQISLENARTILVTLSELPSIVGENLSGPAVLFIGEQYRVCHGAHTQPDAARCEVIAHRASG